MRYSDNMVYNDDKTDTNSLVYKRKRKMKTKKFAIQYKSKFK